MDQLTPAKLEMELRKCLTGPGTVLRITELNGATLAWCEPEDYPAPIVVDPFRGGLIASAVHELLHIARKTELSRWGGLEEPIVLSLEADLMARINSSPSRVRWWRRAIAAKLDKGGE